MLILINCQMEKESFILFTDAEKRLIISALSYAARSGEWFDSAESSELLRLRDLFECSFVG